MLSSLLFNPNRRSSDSNYRMFVIVIAEQTREGWSAWFRNSPDDVCFDNSGLLAILTLIESHGNLDMDPWDMTLLDGRSREGHREYLLPVAIRKPR
jgi:hypothetical protein